MLKGTHWTRRAGLALGELAALLILVELLEILLKPEGTQEHDLYFNYFENPEAWGIVEQEFDRMAALAEAAGICVHVLVHTGNDQLRRLLPHRRINRRIEQAARLQRDAELPLLPGP